MTLADHVLVVLLVLVLPIFWHFDYKRAVLQIVAQGSPARLREYRNTILQLSALGLMAVFAWWYAGRPWADLGLAVPWTMWQGAAFAVAALITGYQMFLLRRVGTDPEIRAAVRQTQDEFEAMSPRSDAEVRYFAGLSLAAGVWEEIVYRGFLIWYLAEFMPVVAAVGLAAVVFGLAHTYQGPKGVIRTAVVGLLFSGIYLLTGSLLVPILLHFAVDVMSGRTIALAINLTEADAALAASGDE